MKTKKFINIILIAFGSLLAILCICFVLLRPIVSTAELSLFTKNLPRSRINKFVLTSALEKNYDSEWGTFELDKKCFDLDSSVDYWTVKGHDDLVFAIDIFDGKNNFIAKLYDLGNENILPDEVSADVFKAIGISKYDYCNNNNWIEVGSECRNSIIDFENNGKSIKFNQNDTLILPLNAEEVEKTIDVLNLKDKKDIFYKAEFTPKKTYAFHLFMNEDDTVFRFSPYGVEIAFDGQQWKMILEKIDEGTYYVADVPFDTSVLTSCE